jgi:hypothetical protein
MHSIQPDNAIRYGLAWMEIPIGSKNNAMGHGGDLMGVDTWMLYIPSEDIGIIYFANGNPVYGLIPRIRSIAMNLLLYSLFKEGGLTTSYNANILNYPHSLFLNFNSNYCAIYRIAG